MITILLTLGIVIWLGLGSLGSYYMYKGIVTSPNIHKWWDWLFLATLFPINGPIGLYFGRGFYNEFGRE